jgi:FixJ family two-component response regulator
MVSGTVGIRRQRDGSLILRRAEEEWMPPASPESRSAEEAEPIVLVVEDDRLVRDSLETLLRSAGLRARGYATAREVLDEALPDVTCCVVLDVRLPQLSGLDLQAELTRRGHSIPIIFITGHGDIPMTVKAMKAGAVDFLAKPFRDQDMLDAVTTALARDRARRESYAGIMRLEARFTTLTLREKQVMKLVTAGLLNKQVAGELGLSEVTVKLHRSSVMRKMEARTLADLVRMAEVLAPAANRA